MAGGHPYIVVKLHTKSPIRIGDFVSEFTSIASQYDKFIKERYPSLAQEAQIFVKEVRRGSIIAMLLPFVPFLLSGEILAHVEHINAINEFVRSFGGKLGAYLHGGKADNVTRSDLKDFIGAIAAIANDPDGKASIASAVFEDGKTKTKFAMTFNPGFAGSFSPRLIAKATNTPYEEPLARIRGASGRSPKQNPGKRLKLILRRPYAQSLR